MSGIPQRNATPPVRGVIRPAHTGQALRAIVLALLCAIPSARAVETKSAATIPVTVVQARPDLGLLKNVVANRDGSALNVSGEIVVDAPRRTSVVKTEPARIRVELIGEAGEVTATQARSLGPHGIHVEGSRQPSFDLHFDVAAEKVRRLRVTLEPDDSH